MSNSATATIPRSKSPSSQSERTEKPHFKKSLFAIKPTENTSFTNVNFIGLGHESGLLTTKPISPQNQFLTIVNTILSFEKITPDEHYKYAYTKNDIIEYIKIVMFILSGKDIIPCIFPNSEGGILVQFSVDFNSVTIEINNHEKFISFINIHNDSYTVLNSKELFLSENNIFLIENMLSEFSPESVFQYE